ncbi:hypothetical protein [Paenibacillus sp. MER 99-2]|uniref:hypothetical protein n=1 Tax=Paenibacillus sp. MER 99-2 TaxID=2939572 RepID=UPI00203EF1EB|nr:hypothetical protein [Paenibacillus sp. MER 99-2]MCM3174354.1 hypothetical protein [Paenibacillus sp. MER 99-2]
MEQSITYQRKTVLLKAACGIILILISLILIVASSHENTGLSRTIYYSSSAILGFWFFGPLLMNMVLLLFTKRVLVSWDKTNVKLRSGELIPWTEIRKIDIHRTRMSKWVQSVPPSYSLTLSGGKQVIINTYHALTNREFTHYFKILKSSWKANK